LNGESLAKLEPVDFCPLDEWLFNGASSIEKNIAPPE
jgi:hypothetical protein